MDLVVEPTTRLRRHVPDLVELRGRVDAVPDAFAHVSLYLAGVGAAGDLAPEPLGVQAKLPGVRHQGVEVEAGRGPQQELVHLPELALGSGGLGCLGGQFGVRVQLRDREVPEHEQDRARVQVEHPVHVPVRTPAERALVVAVLQDRDGRSGRPERVVVGGDFRRGGVLQFRLLVDGSGGIQGRSGSS